MFVNRKMEINYLVNLKKNKFFVLTVFGRRRIGKTTLLRHSFPDSFYIFIPKGRTTQFILDSISENYKIPRFTRFNDLLLYLSEKDKLIIIDEVQNFLINDSGVFSEIQQIIDQNKFKEKKLQLILNGSSFSMLNKLFTGDAPLYNRRTNTLEVRELSFTHTRILSKELCNLNTLEEQILLWAVFGGIPYYYEVFANTELNSITDRISSLFNPITGVLKDEAKLIISSEFGNEYRTYSTIIASIANGKTKPNELVPLFDNKKSNLNKYLHTLVKDYKFVIPTRPVFGNKQDVIYQINDNFLNFWYFFVEKNLIHIETGNFKEFDSYVKDNFNSFMGRRFEDLISNLIKEKIIKIPFEYTKLGKQWGKITGKKGETYEIDLVGVDKTKPQIIFIECKWKENVDGEKIEVELMKKAEYVSWKKQNRKDHHLIIAKSFSKIPKYGKFIDLKGLEKLLG